MNFVHESVSDVLVFPRPYWLNTSSNNIIRYLIERAGAGVKQGDRGTDCRRNDRKAIEREHYLWRCRGISGESVEFLPVYLLLEGHKRKIWRGYDLPHHGHTLIPTYVFGNSFPLFNLEMTMKSFAIDSIPLFNYIKFENHTLCLNPGMHLLGKMHLVKPSCLKRCLLCLELI